MRQSAQVIRRVSPGCVEVKVKRASACSGAHNCGSGSCDGCSMLAGAVEVMVVARDECGAQEGDTVVVESPTSGVMGAAVCLYIAPILLFFAGYLLGIYLGWAEGSAIALGGGGFAIGGGIALLVDRYRKYHRPMEYRVIAIED